MTDITRHDGRKAQDLVTRPSSDPTPTWATRMMLDHPRMVRAVHIDIGGHSDVGPACVYHHVATEGPSDV